jgi:hypothetical protein
MRYAYVRRLECSLSGPKGLDRAKLSEAAALEALGGESDAESRSRDSYCDSSELSMFLYNFLSGPAAFVV